MKVLVATPDRALRGSLSNLLGLEPDLEIQACAPRDVCETIETFQPDVVLATEPGYANGTRFLPLSGLTPYDELLSEVRSVL